MAVPVRHVLRQGHNLGALAQAARIAFQSRGRRGGTFTAPGKLHEVRVPPPAPDLVRDYVRHVGGDPAAYRGTVPAHLFPYWAFPILFRTLEGLPYDVSKVLNAGCTLEMLRPLPATGRWLVTARLESVDEDDRRVLLTQRITTGPVDDPVAMIADVRLILPKRAPKGERRAPPATVPLDAREVASWALGDRAGLDFALLTGDFNPIHWIRPAARAAGFRNVILHGFATLARAVEGLQRNVFAGRPEPIRRVDARFSRPVVLPARVGLFVTPQHDLFVGRAVGAPANLIGTYEPRPETP